jgi:DNA-binding phage protein
VNPRTAAEDYLAGRRADPEYGALYAAASRRISMFDEIVASLNARREELGLTKAELARRANLPPAAVRRLFSQQHKNPTLTTLAAIADALDLRLCAIPSSSTGLSESHHDVAGMIATEGPSPASGTRRRTA